MNTKKLIFEGCATAIITPFSDGKIDFDAFYGLINRQIDSGVSAIVVLGTTGESPTVSESEREEIIRFSRDVINKRVPLIVGTGSNSTEHAVKLTQGAQKCGADAVLSVTPYYNKASERGLALHYKEIAKSTSLPIILYNVPSRTGLKLSTLTLEELREVENIVAIKEASGDVAEIGQKMARFKDSFYFYSGCDELVLPIYSLGGCGVISAVANVMPKEFVTLCSLFEQKKTAEASMLALKLLPAVKELFAEVSPIPTKAALSLMGLCRNELRLPLCPSERIPQLEKMLKSYGLL